MRVDAQTALHWLGSGTTMVKYYSRSLWDNIQSLDEPCVEVYRAQLDEWLAALPSDELPEVDALLGSDDEKNFYATSLELFLSHYLRSHDWQVERHPEIEGTRKRPDFRISTPSGPVYVEATAALESDSERTNARLERALKDHLLTVTGPFEVTMTVLTPIPGGFSGKHARTWLGRQLSTLPEELPSGEVTLTYLWPKAEPRLRIQFDVQRSEVDGPVVRVTNPHGGGVRDVTLHEAIREKVAEKGARYGRLGHPLVVVIDGRHDFPTTGFAVIRALYGDTVVRLSRHDDDFTVAGSSFKRNGAFTAQMKDGSPTTTRVSAVGVYRHHLNGWGGSASTHDLVLFHNPYARHPLPHNVFPDLPQFGSTKTDGETITLGWTGTPPPRWALQ